MPEPQKALLNHVIDLMDHQASGAEEETIDALHHATEQFTSATLTGSKSHKLLQIVRNYITCKREATYAKAIRTLTEALFEIFGGHNGACLDAYSELKAAIGSTNLPGDL